MNLERLIEKTAQLAYARGRADEAELFSHGIRSLAALNGSGTKVLKAISEPAAKTTHSALEYLAVAIADCDTPEEMRSLATLAGDPEALESVIGELPAGAGRKSFRRFLKAFDNSEARDEGGKWTAGGASAAGSRPSDAFPSDVPEGKPKAAKKKQAEFLSDEHKAEHEAAVAKHSAREARHKEREAAEDADHAERYADEDKATKQLRAHEDKKIEKARAAEDDARKADLAEREATRAVEDTDRDKERADADAETASERDAEDEETAAERETEDEEINDRHAAEDEEWEAANEEAAPEDSQRIAQEHTARQAAEIKAIEDHREKEDALIEKFRAKQDKEIEDERTQEDTDREKDRAAEDDEWEKDEAELAEVRESEDTDLQAERDDEDTERENAREEDDPDKKERRKSSRDARLTAHKQQLDEIKRRHALGIFQKSLRYFLYELYEPIPDILSRVRKSYDPAEARDESGEWTAGGAAKSKAKQTNNPPETVAGDAARRFVRLAAKHVKNRDATAISKELGAVAAKVKNALKLEWKHIQKSVADQLGAEASADKGMATVKDALTAGFREASEHLNEIEYAFKTAAEHGYDVSHKSSRAESADEDVEAVIAAVRNAVEKAYDRLAPVIQRHRESKSFRKSYDESLHPRSKNGRFIAKDAIHDAKSDPVLAEKLRDEVRPEDSEKLEAAIGGHVDLGRTKAGQRKHETKQKREAKKNSEAEVMRLTRAWGEGGEGVTADHLHALADHLPNLTRDQLIAARTRIRERLGWGRSAKKQAMVDKLKEWAKGEAAKLETPTEEPAKEAEPAVVAEAPPPAPEEPLVELPFDPHDHAANALGKQQSEAWAAEPRTPEQGDDESVGDWLRRQMAALPKAAPAKADDQHTHDSLKSALQTAVDKHQRNGTSLTPIHQLRDEMQTKFPGMTKDEFDDAVKDQFKRTGSHRMLSISGNAQGEATPEQIKAGVRHVGENMFYITPNGDQTAAEKRARQTREAVGGKSSGNSAMEPAAKATPQRTAEVAAHIKDVYDNAARSGVEIESLRDSLKQLQGLSKPQLIEVAKGIKADKGLQNLSKSEVHREIVKAVEGMWGAAQRVKQ